MKPPETIAVFTHQFPDDTEGAVRRLIEVATSRGVQLRFPPGEAEKHDLTNCPGGVIDAPTSRQSRPAGSIPSRSSALASLMPPRDTKAGASSTDTAASPATIRPGFRARAPSCPTLTWPASTAAAARERDSKRPRSTSSVSSRVFGTAAA